MRRILVLSPHPDDEAIGCGGTIRKHVVEGDAVRIIFLTSGESGGHGRAPEQTRRLREREAQQAARILGVERIEFWGAPDGRLRATADLQARLRSALRAWRPARIYVPHEREMHPDHRATARLLRRGLDGRAWASVEVLGYEVWTPLQQLDEIVDISRYVARKRAAVRAYRCQCAVLAFDEAILGLNRYRGEMHCWPGGDYAEVFVRLRP